MVSVSRAPLAKIEAFRRKKGWTFPWVSSYGGDFNYDFGVSFTEDQRAEGAECKFRWLEPATERPGSLVLMEELHGLRASALEDGIVSHTYSTYAPGTDVLLGTLQLLDRAAGGRAGA